MMCGLRLADGRRIGLERPVIMGILNVTPDSFSDGGQWIDPAAAVEHGLGMVEAGADLIDVGGESTRPGSQRVPADEQIHRVVPVLERLRTALEAADRSTPISIDTTRSAVAESALDAGASIINDIAAGRDDPAILSLAADRCVPLVLMHMRGDPPTMQNDPRYADVVTDVECFLRERVAAATAAGVASDRVVVDPGIGFGKTTEHNQRLLANLDRFVAMGHTVLLGASRKCFMGRLCPNPDGSAPESQDLVEATCATTVLGVAAGVHLFRVHDVLANRRAADVAWAIVRIRHPSRPGPS